MSYPPKIIFIRIPRTGTSTIFRYMSAVGVNVINGVDKGDHFSVRRRHPLQIKEELGEAVWAANLKMTFVRNPWDRFVSQYHDKSKQVCSFEEWLFDPNTRDFRGNRGNKQIDWYRWADVIGRYEVLEKSLRTMYPSDIKLAHRGKSKRRPYQEYYTQKGIDFVAEFDANVIEDFGYAF